MIGLFAVLLACLPGTATAVAAPPQGTPVQVALGVPDQGRAWELVTPAEPTANVVAQVKAFSPDGSRIGFMSRGPLPGATSGSPFIQPAISIRNGSGWETRPMNPPNPVNDEFPTEGGAFYLGPDAFAPDLASAVLQRHLPLQSGQVSNDVGLFRYVAGAGYSLQADIGPEAVLSGTSADLSHILFSSEEHLLPADAARTEGRSVYELDGSTLRLVDVTGAGSLLSTCGSSVFSLKGSQEHGTPDVPNQISRDGRRIFFVTHPSCTGPARVFLRENGTTTTEISASQCTLADCGPEADATFVGATPDGSAAFIVSDQRLTDDDGNEHEDLYRYEVESGQLALLSSRPGGPDAVPALTGVLASADGSRVYFQALHVGETSGGTCLDNQGRPACYFVSRGAGTHQLAPSIFAAVSSDGRFALIETAAALSPADTDGQVDLYRYDAVSDDFTQVSVGNGPFEATAAPAYFSWGIGSHPHRALTEDGSRAFFTTNEPLLPADRNEVADVYEWVNGELGLVSSGAAGDTSTIFLGSTPDGGTVFLRTAQTLVPRDRDGGGVDIYAARIGGGFPETQPPGECESVATCRIAPGASPADPATPTAESSGRLAIAPPSAADRRRSVATGHLQILVETPRPGSLTATAKAKIGARPRLIGAARQQVPAPGTVRLDLRLSRAARRALGAGGALRVSLVAGVGGGPSSTTRFVLGGSR